MKPRQQGVSLFLAKYERETLKKEDEAYDRL